jgi:hypothetical protein
MAGRDLSVPVRLVKLDDGLLEMKKGKLPAALKVHDDPV